MLSDLYKRICSWEKNSKYRNLIVAFAGITIIGSAILWGYDYKDAVKGVTAIQRNDYGEGDQKEQLELSIEGEKCEEKIEVSVSERQYTDEELEVLFKQAIEELEKTMLGDNEGLDNIQLNLNLVTSLPEYPFFIEWKNDRYDVINIYGEINQEVVKDAEEGVMVELKAYLRYQQDESKQLVHIMNCNVYPRERSLLEQMCLQVEEKISGQEEQSVTEEYLVLPQELDGKKLEYKRIMSNRSAVLLLLGCVVSVLLYFLEKEKQKEYEENKQEQMMRDYSEIISKLNLLLGAGMTVKNAWKKIVEDYHRQKEGIGTRFAYEEMESTYREMQSGVSESECYEHFGRNCKLRAYRKLGALLSQNLRKGTKGLTELLNMEAMQAYEERKMQAKRLGEQAGTKLLMPMFLMLSVVLIIVIVPAFLSIQM